MTPIGLTKQDHFAIARLGTNVGTATCVETCIATTHATDTTYGVRKAVVLAAGLGSRLRPLTDRLPKCLVRVNGIPILDNALMHLCNAGIREVVMVVGHLKEAILAHLPGRFPQMEITYVQSEEFATTNNIYSLWLARDHLTEDILLLEGDVFFEGRVLDRVLLEGSDHCGESLVVASDYTASVSGTAVTTDDQGRIESLTVGQRPGHGLDSCTCLKTVNIYLLRASFLRSHFVPRLGDFIASGQVHCYYEAVLGSILDHQECNLRAVRCDDLKWCEVDDENDLAHAQYVFGVKCERHEFSTSYC